MKEEARALMQKWRAAEEMKEAAAAVKRKALVESAGSQTEEMKEALAAAKRKALIESAGSQPSCVQLCNHVGCGRSVVARGVCRGHGPRCKHGGCNNNVSARGVCRGHGPRCKHVGCDNDVRASGVCQKVQRLRKEPN